MRLSASSTNVSDLAAGPIGATPTATADRAALPLRQGRAIAWIHEAIAPLHDQLSEQAIHQLVLAIRSATGIEALAWLTDVAALTRDDAVALMSWSAQALLDAALNWTPPGTAEADGRSQNTASPGGHPAARCTLPDGDQSD